MQLPAIDQTVCGSWTEDQQASYQQLPYYFNKAAGQHRKRWETFGKLMGSVPWEPNNGDTMRSVAVEPTPIIRQSVDPNRINTAPKTDVINVRERFTDTQLYWQDFISPNFSFLKSYEAFLKGAIKPTHENIMDQMMVWEEFFYRWFMWNWSPYVYVCGVGLVAAPTGGFGSDAKSAGWLAANVIEPISAAQNAYLDFANVFAILSAMESEIGATPFAGSGLPGGDNSPLNEKYCLVHGSQIWRNFIDDPWLRDNKPLNLDYVDQGFKGRFFNQIVGKCERYPMRFAYDADFQYSLPAPQTSEENPDAQDYGRTKPNPAYEKIVGTAEQCCPIEVSWLMGGSSYDKVKLGAPPPDFSSPLNGNSMDWSGKVFMNKDFLIKCADGSLDTNSFGRWVRMQATKAAAVRGFNPQNCLPIISKRRNTIERPA